MTSQSSAKKFFYFDTETTGLESDKHDIIQLSGLIVVDGKIEENFNFKVKPFFMINCDDKALKINGVTKEQLEGYPKPQSIYKQLISTMEPYVNRYDNADKFFPVGYNVKFDVGFLETFFKRNNDMYYGSWFNRYTIDPFEMVKYMYAIGKLDLPNLKLETVCNHFGIKIKAHDAMSDIIATRELFKIIASKFQC